MGFGGVVHIISVANVAVGLDIAVAFVCVATGVDAVDGDRCQTSQNVVSEILALPSFGFLPQVSFNRNR